MALPSKNSKNPENKSMHLGGKHKNFQNNPKNQHV